MNKKIMTLIPAVLSLLMAAGTATVFRACAAKEDGTWMHCHTAQNAVVAAGVILFVLFVINTFVSARTLHILIYVVGIAAGVVTFLIPGVVVSMCMMNTMRCYAVMQPFVRVMSALIAVVSAAGLIGAARK